MCGLTHLSVDGEAHMVDIADKAVTSRTARAIGHIRMKPETLAMALSGNAKKGDVLGTARLAGIMAAKRTHELIPLCHPLLVTKIAVDLKPDALLPGIRVEAMVNVLGQTGVEMEALTAVSVTCLTLYDMLKAADRFMQIGGIAMVEKSGGKSGTWKALAGGDDAG